ncbi:hypothetical protein [Sediminitomix flava]|uniref:Phosphate-selective porin O/P n=1 Tax=Sediminitomix flava TaxID=379075 RepID=A0A315ZBJ9_SEDFL|nr:hypothetical protein [Sediminitomix flava]PWJ42956.1 hypothetical protein BC781_102503 [Sediminitomix flava]
MKKLFITALAAGLSLSAFAQNISEEEKEQIKKEIKEERKEENRKAFSGLRENNQNGINVFEAPKSDLSEFDGIKVRVGGNFNMMFQGMTQENYYNGVQTETGAPAQYSLTPLGQDFNLPQANFNIDVAFAPGVTMKLETYLSTRHHVEANVKGGYLQLDALPFLNSPMLDNIMKNVTIKAGLMEINYGDSHFRRSDGGNAIYNPFVGNYLMDAFTTELGMEILYRHETGALAMIGVSNGKLNQTTMELEGAAPSLYGKAGFDKQINEDLRVRLTGSVYHSFGDARAYLYSGDRAGGRYYSVMSYYNEDGGVQGGGDWSGRMNHSFYELTAVTINPFVKYKGLEFFGTYDRQWSRETEGKLLGGRQVENGGALSQFGADLLYRFGQNEKFYVGARYNTVTGNLNEDSADINIQRVNVGGGWFMTKNILVKAEYVNQQYKDETYKALGEQFNAAKFNGVNVEAVIAF